MSENTVPYTVETAHPVQRKAIPDTVDQLQAFYAHLFQTLEKIIAHHQTFGNWSFGGGVPALKPLPAQTELGLWYAEGRILGFVEPAAISLAVLPSECRIGLFLPNDCLVDESTEKTLDHAIMECYGLNIPGVHLFTRKGADRTLFDHVLHEPPFDTDSLAKALREHQSRNSASENMPYFALLVQRLGYIVTTIWAGAIRIVYENAKTGMGTWIIWTNPDTRILPQHMHGLPNAHLLRSNEIGMRVAVEIRTTAHADRIQQHFAQLGITVLGVEKVMEI